MAETWVYDSQGYYVLCPPYNIWGTDTPEAKIRFNKKPSTAQLKLYIIRIRVAEWFGLVPPHDVDRLDNQACWAVVNGTRRDFTPTMPPLEKFKEYSCSITDLIYAGENTIRLHFTPSNWSIEYWIQLKLVYEDAEVEEIVIPPSTQSAITPILQYIMNNGPMIVQMLIIILTLALLLKIL